ncbi:hypothetical protein BN14_03338 [Rhizoctonia solani AG-1 IB]|uniref:DH domain-containing protein n=1 Tax=Thanatephorus cucumeris (strain AG1-IB / isolate 7/3/14) TaxID=1108050 RepID=M5BQ59_THACB|nr:hypothetical protein BN14_03338 [Rhizoctonia solani AG-1 IB]
MVIQLPLPSTGSPSPAQESVGSPSTRTSTSQLSLLVESPEHVYPNKRPDSIPEQKTSKRTHALLELLSSERAYASDLALIRDIFLPLAQGKPTTFPLPPSVGSLMFPMHQDPPMSAQDVRIVFGNIEELASFADELSERLELAVGSIVLGGTGHDRVGELFCELVGFCVDACVLRLGLMDSLTGPEDDSNVLGVYHSTSCRRRSVHSTLDEPHSRDGPIRRYDQGNDD